MSNILSITNFLLKGYREEEKKRNDFGGIDFGHFFLSAIHNSNQNINFDNNFNHNNNIFESQTLNKIDNIKSSNETINDNNYNLKFNSNNSEIFSNTSTEDAKYTNNNLKSENRYNSPENFENRIDKNNKSQNIENNREFEKTSIKKVDDNTKNTFYENLKLTEKINKIAINDNKNRDENKIKFSYINKEQKNIKINNKEINNLSNSNEILNNLASTKKENIKNININKNENIKNSKNINNESIEKNYLNNNFSEFFSKNNLNKLDKSRINEKEETNNTKKIKNNLNDSFNIQNLSKREKEQIKEELLELNKINEKKIFQKDINNKKEENLEKKEINKNNLENLNQNILINKNKGDINNKIEFNKDEFSKFFIKELKWNLSLNEKNYLNTLNSVKWDINGNSYILKIDLYPENLGKIEVILNKNNDILTGKILAESSLVGDKLKENIELIINNLAENGINILSFNISTSTYQKGNEKYETMKNELEINKISSSLNKDRATEDTNLILNNKNNNSNISYYSDLYIGRKVNIRI